MSATAEDFDDFDDYEDDDEEGGISGFSVLLVILLVLAMFALIVFFAYKKGMTEGSIANGSVPTIAADPTPAKTERDITVAGAGNQEVYDRLEGTADTDVIAIADPLDGYDETSSAAAEVAANQVETATPEPVVTAPRPKPAVIEPVVAAAPATLSTSGSALSGSHVVQIGAFRSNDEAMRFFKRLSTKHGTLVSQRSTDVQVADLGTKGTYYRLRLGPFNNKSAASDYCSALKGKGQDCLVKTK